MNIQGKLTDNFTRCLHYHLPLDIIAIKFKCCNTYYACIHCHEELANHIPQQWSKDEFDTRAILCGNCKEELAINEYFNSDNKCPNCEAHFNPKCSNHYHYYFEA